MNPWELLESTNLPSGEAITLSRRGDEYALRVENFELMNSRQSSSEEQLAVLAAERVGDLDRASVLIGGLGMGFTLRAALDSVPANAKVTVAELVPEVVEWNRKHLGHLAGEPLSDRRTKVVVGDVAEVVKRSQAEFDMILLDTDNGPEGTTQFGNSWLYAVPGLRAMARAVRPGGVLSVWSAFPSDPFTKRLTSAGFEVEVKNVRSRGKKGNRHVIWLARSGRRKS